MAETTNKKHKGTHKLAFPIGCIIILLAAIGLVTVIISAVNGIDTAIEQDRSAAVIQNAGLPIFAMNTGDKAFFAVIDSGEAVATVNAEVYGKKFLQSRMFASFNCKSVDSSNAGALRSQSSLNLYAKNFVSDNIINGKYLGGSVVVNRMLNEGIEETMEEALGDAVKALALGAEAMGFKVTKDPNAELNFGFSVKDIMSRYSAAFLGGSIGGAIFEGYNN